MITKNWNINKNTTIREFMLIAVTGWLRKSNSARNMLETEYNNSYWGHNHTEWKNLSDREHTKWRAMIARYIVDHYYPYEKVDHDTIHEMIYEALDEYHTDKDCTCHIVGTE